MGTSKVHREEIGTAKIHREEMGTAKVPREEIMYSLGRWRGNGYCQGILSCELLCWEVFLVHSSPTDAVGRILSRAHKLCCNLLIK